MNKVYEIVTEKILAQLEKGNVPWCRPWRVNEQSCSNLVSKKEYNGVNRLLTSIAMLEYQYSSPYWVTFNQANQLGGHVKKGEHGTLVVFWKLWECKPKTVEQEKKEIPILRYYLIFNVEQTEGIDPKKIPALRAAEPGAGSDETCDALVAKYQDAPAVKHGGERAFYRWATDEIGMPIKAAFHSTQEYYSTLFHELVHSTGHEKRCDRQMSHSNSFGDDNYSREELVAEMGAAFMCSMAGIEQATIENAAAYIQNWRSKISQDSGLVVHAAGGAQKAVDYITGAKQDKQESDD